MWEDYRSTHADISYIVYQRVFQLENNDFGKPTQDECDVCAKCRTHCKDPDEAHDVVAWEQCKVGRDHEKRLKKLTLITAKTWIKMQMTLLCFLLIRKRSSFFPK